MRRSSAARAQSERACATRTTASTYRTSSHEASRSDSITVLNLRIGTERVMSISFHDNVFDRQAISTLADHLSDPIRFLTPTSPA